jgi:hypothetical protein
MCCIARRSIAAGAALLHVLTHLALRGLECFLLSHPALSLMLTTLVTTKLLTHHFETTPHKSRHGLIGTVWTVSFDWWKAEGFNRRRG